MKNGDWAEKIQHMQQRIEQLWRRAGQSLTLSEALEEIATTLEELSVAHEELRQQNEELLESRHALEAEHQRYSLSHYGYDIKNRIISELFREFYSH